MSWDPFDWADYDPEPQVILRPEDDPAVRAIEPEIFKLLDENPAEVYYETQLAVRFERQFFHWVTVRALKLLRESNRIGTSLEELMPGVPLRFYFHKRNRYWRRRARALREVIRVFAEPQFSAAVGNQGEVLIDAGLPRVGFLPLAHTIRSWKDRAWNETGHDLDRIFERDGIQYGAEIKNRLGYIERDEFSIKLRMCLELGLTPLFVARMMPKTYIEEVRRAGGFCLLMGRQFYPFAHKAFALRVNRELGLPVDSPIRLEDATLQRFLTWHLKKRERKNEQ